jgi:cytidylate kinase
MAIITISRELAALGDETAHELAKLLNYRFVDKQSLEERIKSYGVADRKFEKYDERKPSIFASLSQDRDDYLHYLKTAIFTEAGGGNCVFIGRGAGAVFKNTPGVLSIFLIAPGDIRNERVKSYFHCDERRARQIIERSDQNRLGFHRYFFDIDWRAPENYHLSLNTGYLSPAICAELIKNLLKNMVSGEMEAQNARRLRELTLAQQVVHHILYEKEIPIHFLESSVSENTVTLYGVAGSQALVESAVSSAKEVPPVADVHSEIQVVQEYSVMP